MKIQFTQEMLNKYLIANDKVSGTNNYNRFYMMQEAKINGRWKFIGWSFVNQLGYFTCPRHTVYLTVENKLGDKVRYTVTNEVLGLFKEEFTKLNNEHKFWYSDICGY